MIKHILDRVLNTETPYETTSPEFRASGLMGAADLGLTDFGAFQGVSEFPVFGAEMENWFDSVEFGGTPWDTSSFAMGACRSY